MYTGVKPHFSNPLIHNCKSNMNRNIFNLYVIKASKWFMLIMPIVVLFYNENGLNQFQVFVLQSIYSISIVAFEIPSGYLADVLGRKKSIIIGSILGFLGFAVYSFSWGFSGFVIAEVVLGIGQSMISGADSAILYDTLAAQDRKGDYMRLEGRISSIGNFAEATAGVLGGLLAVYSLRYPYYVQTAIMFFSIPAAFSLVEPPSAYPQEQAGWAQIKSILKYALVDNQILRFNILFSSITGAATLTMAWCAQPFFKVIHLPLPAYGVLWTVLNLIVGLVSWYGHRIESKLKQRNSLLIITFSIAACTILLGLFPNYWGLSFLFVFYMTRGFATPILKDYINSCTESNVRATVLSIRNFMIRLIFAVVGPIMGYLTDKIGLSQALFISGATYFLFGVTSCYCYLKVIKNNA